MNNIYIYFRQIVSLLYYSSKDKVTLSFFITGSLFSMSSILMLIFDFYQFSIIDIPFISTAIVLVSFNFLFLGYFYNNLKSKSYNRAHIVELGYSDLRDLVILLNYCHFIQFPILVFSLKITIYELLIFNLTMSYSLVICYYYFLNNKIQKQAIRSGKSLYVPSELDYDLEVTADSFFSSRIEVVGNHKILKKRINSELRNSILCFGEKTEINFKSPVDSSLLEISISNVSNFQNKTSIIVYFDDQIVLNKHKLVLHNGWNDFNSLTNLYKKKSVSKIKIFLEKGEQIFFTFNIKTVVSSKDQKNIIVLLLDGLRKDMLGIYNGSEDTKNINNFFSDYSKYETAYVQGEWTLPTFASMATSLYSSHHRVLHPDYSKTRSLPEDIETFSEILQKNNYQTLYYANAPRTSHLMGYQRGNNQLFYQQNIRDSKSMILNTIEFMNIKNDQNKIVFLHLMDLRSPMMMNSPYCWEGLSLGNQSDIDILNNIKPTGNDKMFTQMYKNKVKEVDSLFGLLFDKINNSDLIDNTSVILTSDHGINLPTDNVNNWRGKQFSDERMNVPFLLRCPWREETHNKTFSGFIESSIDLYPTILDLSCINNKYSYYSNSVLPDKNGIFNGKKHVVSEMLYKNKYDCRILGKEYEYTKNFYFNDKNYIDEKIISLDSKISLDKNNNENMKLFNQFRKIVEDLDLLSFSDDIGQKYQNIKDIFYKH